MICPKCGTANEDAANFCQNCAHPLTAPPSAPIELLAAPSRKRVNDPIEKALLICIVISLVVAFLVLAFGDSVLNSMNYNNNGNNSANNNNGGTNPVNPVGNNNASDGNQQAATPTFEVKLSGKGDTVTSTFELKAGNAIFETTHDGSSVFVIWLTNQAGNKTALIATAIGQYTGSTLVGIPSTAIVGTVPGTYYLDVTANGNWTATITQPQPTTAPSLPLTFQGTTNNVTAAFTLTAGAIKFDMAYNGASFFSAFLYDSNGNLVGLLGSQIGNYTGSHSQAIISTGIYYLSITGIGSWSITVTHM